MTGDGASTPAFNLLESPLDGTALIEAGAGTGKTFTITGIVLRLLLERRIAIRQILVVTFTEAATEELKGRIRNRLKAALRVFRGEGASDDFLVHLAERCGLAAVDAVSVLTEAIRDFDEAAIFTIHGFCNRMLRENAFESGTLFDTELTTDQDRIRRIVVEDFWRTRLYAEDPTFVRYALTRTSPERLFALVANPLVQPGITVIPDEAPPDPRAAEAEFKAAYRALQECWAAAKADIEALLMETPALNRRSYSTKSIPAWVELMDAYLRPVSPHPVLPDKFEKFTPTHLKKGTKKNCSPPVHPFFEACGAFKEAHKTLLSIYERRLIHLKRSLFAFAGEQVRQRMRDANTQSFDDLLRNLSDALKGPGGALLAETIRGRYQAALIDEFQDTDPVQYHIFQTVFDAPGHLLFLIGDPKQAIYSFRGADIFAYMTAAEQAAARYTLLTNWRSTRELIAAVNAVFSGHPRAFVFGEIPFFPAVPSREKEGDSGLAIDGETPPPFTCWRVCEGTKGDAVKKVIQATADEISRLLWLGQQGRATLGGAPLRAGDVAVLTRTNREAAEVQSVLNLLGIPAVLCNTGDIFDSREAAETARVLAALAEPRSDRRIRAALATDMMGWRGEDLAEAVRDEAAWEDQLARFGVYHRLWQERGFIRMFRAFLAEERVLPRLMGLPGGERRCTNALHLSELLHQASLAGHKTPQRLAAWLSEHRFPGDQRTEEHPLRLESDENAVTLVTIHKSKGLQYPVVFCPLGWRPSRLRDTENGILFHDDASGRRLTCDLGSDETARHRMLAEKEALAENLRLFYVALTRARHGCTTAWGRIPQTETSAPAYLFHGRPEDPDSGDLLGTLEKRIKAMDEADWDADMAELEARAGGTLRIQPLPDAGGIRYSPPQDGGESLAARHFSGRIPDDAAVSSFSAMVAGATDGGGRIGGIHDPAELADHDAGTGVAAAAEINDPPRPAREAPDIFAFPRGARAGTCLHDILEHVDFTQTRPTDVAPLIQTALRKYRFSDAWIPVVLEMIGKVAGLALGPDAAAHAGDAPPMRLSSVPPKERINEMAFYFPLRSVPPRRLASVFAQHGIAGPSGDFPERIGRLEFSRKAGYMKGFIDLVFRSQGRFWVVDWKSNHLGDQPEDYRPEVLQEVMAEDFYILQYHLYTLALHRYLQLRLPGYDYDTHFGGVRYLFLRGITSDDAAPFGMFQDRPQAAVIHALNALLVDAPAGGAPAVG